MQITYQSAEQAESTAIKALLKKCDLPSDDIDLHLPNFITAKSDNGRVSGRIIGVVGLEVYGRAGLLRSMAVEPDFRKQGIARSLNERVFTKAHLLGLQELFLLTITAVEYSARLGFNRIERESVPQSILNTAEFRTLCPETAVCFHKRIDEDIRYYPADMLQLKPDVEGVRMWGVALKKSMLTYFECNANCRFEKHSHESEQITFVFQGELYFEIETGVVRVKEGEVIAVPSNVPHAVFTRDIPAKACDAWSPVMKQYK